MKIENRVVVITGAAGGSGRVAARRLAETGARLVLVGSRVERLDALVKELKLGQDQALCVGADLRQAEAAQQVLDAALAKFGRVDILLHFVGGWLGGKPVPQVTDEDVASMLEQHVWTTFHMARVLVPHLTANGWGRIVVISSPSAAAPPARGLAYSMGKAAQEALMVTLAEELKGTGVTANILRVKTIDVDHQRDRQPSAANASWTTPEEIADAVVYLLSDAAGAVNGARIPLYGSP